jgi:hypothetical protein
VTSSIFLAIFVTLVLIFIKTLEFSIMKKRAILFLGVLAGFSLSAQNVSLVKPQKEVAQPGKIVHNGTQTINNKSQAILWSEDFTGGIPSTWGNRVTTDAGVLLPNGSWEFRGPSTTPSSASGSRGAYSGITTNNNLPIASPTASTGFVIFDSDYMDNNGVPGAFGTGVAPSPHIAILTTDTIDLTGSPFVELKMNVYARQFQSRFLVAISNDGGVTYTDTAEFLQDVGVNSATARNRVVSANISAAAGNQDEVVLQVIFDGDYYFWMVDDMVIQDLPKHELKFTDASDGAPAHDIIFGNADGGPKMGHMSLSHAQSITFDSNLFNFGSQTQVNVTLHVEIFNSTGTLVNTLSSTPLATLASGDTATYVNLVTPAWTPTTAGTFDIVYTYTTDSISSAVAARDSFQVVVSNGDQTPGSDPYDVNSIDFGTFSNSFGTTTADYGTDGGGQGVIVELTPGNNQGQVLLEGIQVGFSQSTIDGGDILVEVYDTTGFDFTAGFGGSALISEQFNLATGTSGTVADFIFTTGAGPNGAVILPEGVYYVVVYTFSNGGTNTILIANDQSFSQGANSIMYFVAASRWYTGYNGSLTFNAPWIRTLSETYNGIGLEENNANALSVYPNPTTGNVNISLTNGGKYTVEVVDMVGNVVSREEVTVNSNEKLTRDFSNLTNGIYLLNVNGENFSKTTKLTIQ